VSAFSLQFSTNENQIVIIFYPARMKNINIELGKILDFLRKNNFEKSINVLIDESSGLNYKPVILNNDKISDIKIAFQEGNADRQVET